MTFSLPLAIAAFVAGLFLLERGADLFTDSLGELAEGTGASETVLGLLTAGMEWEELLVSVVAAFSGNVGIAVGNVIGASVANILGTFSLGPLIRPVSVTREDRRFALFLGVVTTAVAGLLILRPAVDRPVGILLTGTFLLYTAVLVWLLRRGLVAVGFEREEESGGEDGASPGKLFVLVFAGLALILGGAHLVVKAGAWFAGFFGVSEFVVGLTVVALGTTIPDKVITVVGSLKGQSGVVTANMIGSNVFNLLFVLGAAAIVHPLYVDAATRRFDLPVLVGVTWLVTFLMARGPVRRGAGMGLMTAYIAYILWNFLGK